MSEKFPLSDARLDSWSSLGLHAESIFSICLLNLASHTNGRTQHGKGKNLPTKASAARRDPDSANGQRNFINAKTQASRSSSASHPDAALQSEARGKVPHG